MSMAARAWAVLPVRRSVLVLSQSQKAAARQPALRAHRYWASQSAEAPAAVPAGAREQAELPPHLKRIMDEYDAEQKRQAAKATPFFKFIESRYAGLFGLAVAGSLAFLMTSFDDTASNIHEVTAWFLRQLQPETARRLFVGAGAWGLLPRDYDKDDPFLMMEPIEGFDFRTPVGLSSGFDLEGRAANAFFNLGFGFVEVGPVLLGDAEVDSNVAAVRERLATRDMTDQVASIGILGLALGGGHAALAAGVRELGSSVDYFIVDLGLVPCAERDEDGLRRLFTETVQAASKFTGRGGSLPVFLRVPEDWPQASSSAKERRSAVVAVSAAALAGGVKGLILAGESEGRSSHTLLKEKIGDAYSATNGSLTLIADGVTTGIEALECIEAGASLVQISTLLLTRGPGACRRLKDELGAAMWKEHYTQLSEAVGSAHTRRRAGQQTGRTRNLWKKRA